MKRKYLIHNNYSENWVGWVRKSMLLSPVFSLTLRRDPGWNAYEQRICVKVSLVNQACSMLALIIIPGLILWTVSPCCFSSSLEGSNLISSWNNCFCIGGSLISHHMLWGPTGNHSHHGVICLQSCLFLEFWVYFRSSCLVDYTLKW